MKKLFSLSIAALMALMFSFTGCKSDDDVAVESVTLNRRELSLVVDGEGRLIAAVHPENATNKNLTWDSDAKDVAIVSSAGSGAGLVKALKEGTAKITVKTEDGGYSDTCDVTVLSASIAVTGVTLDEKTLQLFPGESRELIATVAPPDAANKKVAWQSSNEAAATVSSDGNVMAIAEGTATITVTTEDGDYTDTCDVTVTGGSSEPDIFVVGFERFNVPTGYVPTLWKNGVPQYLNYGDGNGYSYADSYATSVFVAGGDVYVAGLDIPNAEYYTTSATLWKNGAPQRLGDETRNGEALSVFVSSDDVYVAGFEKNDEWQDVPTVWKNGEPHPLSDGSWFSRANSVFVSSGNVYAAGFEYDEEVWRQVAMLWVNGAPHPQPSGDSDTDAEANCVFVSSDGRVYVAGTEDGHAALWTDGHLQRLSGDNGGAFSVFVSNNNVYVAGEERVEQKYVPTLWVNNAPPIRLSGNSGNALSVFVFGDDVYVAGNLYNEAGDRTATLWINSVAQPIGDGSRDTYCYCVFAAAPSGLVPVRSVDVTPASTDIPNGQTLQLIATVLPDNASNKAVAWASSDDGVATVSPTGLVTARSVGNATITVTTIEGDNSASCAVAVTPISVTGVSVFPASMELLVNGERQLQANVRPDNAENKAVTWASSNEGIATVSATGLVKANASVLGEAVITATTVEGGFEATCKVNVVSELTNIHIAGGLEFWVVYPFWAKNEESEYLLTDEQRNNSNFYAQAYSTFVADDGSVYVAGWDNDDYWGESVNKAAIWKDGQPYQYLAKPLGQDVASEARSIVVSGQNIYVAGVHGDYPYIWVNNEPASLPITGPFGTATSLAVSDGVAYVAGFGFSGSYQAQATLWIDGTPADLHPAGASESYANSVCVSGGHVYVAGYYIPDDGDWRLKAALWKDGVLQELQDYAVEGVRNDSAESVFVAGDSVYMAGNATIYDDNYGGDIYAAVLWENGAPRLLTMDPDLASEASSVYAHNGAAYVLGFTKAWDEYGDVNAWDMTVWKNGDVFMVIPAPPDAPTPQGVKGYQHFPRSIFVTN